MTGAAFPPALPVEQRPTISASRLKTIGGSNGCERKCAGAYLWGMKQSPSDATEFGGALHKLAEVYQITGSVVVPESKLGVVFNSGAHYLDAGATPWGQLLIEHEHRGFLPCGTPYVAYLDGSSTIEAALARGGVVLLRDLKTTSDPKWALTAESLPKDIQPLFYGWILLCDDGHWYAPRLGDGEVGPQQWKQWRTAGLRSVSLEWIYFLTRGSARAWIATDDSDTLPTLSAGFVRAAYDMHIAPLVAKINALHSWRAAHPDATLDEIDRSPEACGGRGRWCGVAERNACNFEHTGVPVLVKLTADRSNPRQQHPEISPAMTENPRLAALRQRALNAAATPATPATPAAEPTPKAPEPAVAAVAPVAEPAPESTTPSVSVAALEAEIASAPAAVVESASAAPAVSAPSEEPKRGRGRPRGTVKAPPVPTGGINPPEVVEALAKLTAAIESGEIGADAAPAPAGDVAAPAVCPSGVDLAALLNVLVGRIPVGVTITIAGQR